MASPVYCASVLELFTAIIAAFGFDPGAQPAMAPSKVAKMKSDEFPPTANPPDPLNTSPVGWPGPLPLADGIVTCNPCLTPAPVYSVDHPDPLSLIQNGDPGERAIPHPFTSSGSSCLACPA